MSNLMTCPSVNRVSLLLFNYDTRLLDVHHRFGSSCPVLWTFGDTIELGVTFNRAMSENTVNTCFIILSGIKAHC